MGGSVCIPLFFFSNFLDIGTHLTCSHLKRLLLKNPGGGARLRRRKGQRLRGSPGGDGARGEGQGLGHSPTMASWLAEVCRFLKTRLLWVPRSRTLWTVPPGQARPPWTLQTRMPPWAAPEEAGESAPSL